MDAAAIPVEARETHNKAEAIEALIAEVDLNEAAVLAAAKEVGELDGRGTTLLLASTSLFALCRSAQKPDGVEVLGFSFKFGDWTVIAILIAVLVAYLALLFLLAAWSELRRWRLSQVHTLRRSMLRVGELAAHAERTLDALQQKLAMLSASVPDLRLRRFEFPERPGEPPASIDEVMRWFEQQVLQEKDRLRTLGWYDVYPQSRWERSIAIEREFVRRNAQITLAGDRMGLAEQIAAYHKIADERAAHYRELGPENRALLDTDEQALFRSLQQACAGVARRTGLLLQLLRCRFTLVVALPMAVALFSLGVFAADVVRPALGW